MEDVSSNKVMYNLRDNPCMRDPLGRTNNEDKLRSMYVGTKHCMPTAENVSKRLAEGS